MVAYVKDTGRVRHGTGEIWGSRFSQGLEMVKMEVTAEKVAMFYKSVSTMFNDNFGRFDPGEEKTLLLLVYPSYISALVESVCPKCSGITYLRLKIRIKMGAMS